MAFGRQRDSIHNNHVDRTSAILEVSDCLAQDVLRMIRLTYLSIILYIYIRDIYIYIHMSYLGPRTAEPGNPQMFI